MFVLSPVDFGRRRWATFRGKQIVWIGAKTENGQSFKMPDNSKKRVSDEQEYKNYMVIPVSHATII